MKTQQQNRGNQIYWSRCKNVQISLISIDASKIPNLFFHLDFDLYFF